MEVQKNSNGIQMEVRKTDTDTVTDTDTSLPSSNDSRRDEGARSAPTCAHGTAKRQRKPTMQPPTADEVRAYAAAKGLAIDAERFVDYYTAQGWKLSNGNALKDWMAAARNWARRNSPTDAANQTSLADIILKDGGQP